jgi:hypothetical protein
MIFHKPNESQAHAAAVYLFDLDRVMRGPEKTKDPLYQARENYMHEYAVQAVTQRILEFLKGPDSWKQHNCQLDDERSCYYCTPAGGCNDDDVIRAGICTCWCHEKVELHKLQDRLEALL